MKYLWKYNITERAAELNRQFVFCLVSFGQRRYELCFVKSESVTLTKVGYCQTSHLQIRDLG